jgi:hypothetical protein
MSFPASGAAFGADTVAIERTFLRQVFAWMFLALALTTGVAIYFSQTYSIYNYFALHHSTYLIALFAWMGMAMVLGRSLRAQSMSVGAAAFFFFLFAAVTGGLFSVLLDVYTTDSVVGAFAGAAGLFAGMAAVGYTTKIDLSRFGGIIIGAAFGVVAASIAYIFIGGSTFNLIIGYVGVIAFSALTAYDMQRLKRMNAQGFANAQTAEKLAIFGALQLYINFINLFISLLRIFGGGRR